MTENVFCTKGFADNPLLPALYVIGDGLLMDRLRILVKEDLITPQDMCICVLSGIATGDAVQTWLADRPEHVIEYAIALTSDSRLTKPGLDMKDQFNLPLMDNADFPYESVISLPTWPYPIKGSYILMPDVAEPATPVGQAVTDTFRRLCFFTQYYSIYNNLRILLPPPPQTSRKCDPVF
jgi:hypothetical protein